MTDTELKALVSLLDDTDAEVVRHVEQKIFTLGETVIPFLEQQWEESVNNLVLQKRLEDMVHRLQFSIVQKRLYDWALQGGKDLLEGMWIVLSYQYPDYSWQAMKSAIEQLYYDIWLEHRPDLTPFEEIKLLNSIFFDRLKFRPNTQNFHSPGNSMLNNVIETKRGNPISLCVIYMLVAQKLNLPIFGVNLPNLFILTYKSNDLQFYVNVYNRGLIFSRPDIDNYIAQLNLQPQDVYYEPCTHLDIVKRTLRNLVVSFEKLGDSVKEQEVKQLLAQLEAAEQNM